MTKTAIVILNWNGLEFLKKFLPSVIKYSELPETKVIVADNKSEDDSVVWLKSSFPQVQIIELDKNYGFAGGYKKALLKIEATYFVLLNSDVEVTEGWLEPIVSYMDKNSDVAACQPKILSFYNRESFEYAGAAGGFIDKFGYPFCRGRIFNSVEKDKGQYDDYKDIFWASGACITIRVSAYTRCSGLDEDFFAHMEEIDLCWRFLNSGYRISYIPESVIYHVGGGTLPYDSVHKTYLNFRNNLFLLYKNLPDDKLFTTLFIRKSLDGISALMFLLSGNPGNFMAVVKAHIDYYKAGKRLKQKRKETNTKVSDITSSLILNKSIVFQFYILGRKRWTSLL